MDGYNKETIFVIKRIWHGWTTPGDADRYEALLRAEIFPGIAAKEVDGYRGVELLRRDARRPDDGPGGDGEVGEVEFVTIMSFDSMDAVAEFAGADPGAAYVPPAARQVLARFDERVRHYEVRPGTE